MIQWMTHQELFDNSAKHMMAQRRAGLLPKGGGSYRGHGGYCCPIGAIIKNEDYRTCMEGVPIRFLSAPLVKIPIYMDVGVAALRQAMFNAKVNIHDESTVALLSALQNVNDVFGTWEWKDRFTSIANNWLLSTVILEEW